MRYSQERKQAVLAKLAPPHKRTVREVAAGDQGTAITDLSSVGRVKVEDRVVVAETDE